jgi:hypothetical protein
VHSSQRCMLHGAPYRCYGVEKEVSVSRGVPFHPCLQSAKIDLFSDRRDAGGEVDENGEPEVCVRGGGGETWEQGMPEGWHGRFPWQHSRQLEYVFGLALGRT